MSDAGTIALGCNDRIMVNPECCFNSLHRNTL
jgi:hypothetical protein